jgi:dUTP pyrophosphatase
MLLRIRRLDDGLEIPEHAFADDAALDLRARIGTTLPPAGGRSCVPTGIAVAIPAGHVGLVVPRSGLAANHGITVLNAPGVIDPGFRGEIIVVLVNHDPHASYEVSRGDRIAQLLVTAISPLTAEAVDALDTTPRADNGIGSSGR